MLPLLYLRGLSSSDFVPALQQFLGTSSGLSAPVITRLTAQWQDQARAFADRDLSGLDYVYLWADGVHLDGAKLCPLVLIGVRVDGRRELVALAEGYRESEGSWADLLRDCARRGMHAPVLAAGDGGAGVLERAAGGVPDPRSSAAGSTRSPMCWWCCRSPRIRGRRKALAQIWNAEDRNHAGRAVAAFKLAYCAKLGKAVAKVVDDMDELLAFYDFPAEH